MVKNPPAKEGSPAGDAGLIPGLGRSPGGGHGNPFQCSCLENSTGREAWWATVHGVAKELDTTEQLTLSLQGFFLKISLKAIRTGFPKI